jgi:hypothetical protein
MFLDDSAGVWGWDVTASSGVPFYVWRIATSEQMRLNTTGLGITEGNNPTQALSLYRSGSTNAIMSAGNSNTGLDGTWFGVDTAGNGIVNVRGAFPLLFSTSALERARITSGGDFLLGATSGTGNAERLFVTNAQNNVAIFKGTGGGLAQVSVWNDANKGPGIGAYASTYGGGSNFSVGPNGSYISTATGAVFAIGTSDSQPFIFGTSNVERARITSGGEFYVGQTAGSINVTGAYITGTGQAGFCISGNTPILTNRKTSDGTLISFRQDDTEEGTISVSGATVSYNAFAGSHWSQLQDGSKPDILRGTVMESINELCVWLGESNERLPKAKISDTAGSKKVYGVFMAWDNDWTETNDMYVTAVGAFICRVNGSVTVQEGDLLESNGDGTARVQSDDIIRSSTIGKVTSTIKTHQYDDGSYCVPTVLYCG